MYDPQTGNLLLDLNSSNAVQIRYLSGTSQNEYLGRQDGSGNTSWYLTDRLGSVIGLTNGSGTATDTIVYDGFGNMTSNSAPTVTGNIGFQGMFTDPATGQSGSGARQEEYNPTTGSWTNPDPSGLSSGSNPYEAMGNEPTDATDPSGEDFIAIGGKTVLLNKGHLSLEYWKSDVNPELYKKMNTDQFNKFIDGVKNSGKNVDMEGSVELDQTKNLKQGPWTAIGYEHGLLGGWEYKTVAISVIRYGTSNPTSGRVVIWASGGESKHTNDDVKEKWDLIMKFAKLYAFAEQPGWDDDPSGKNIKNWPNSLYIIDLRVAFGETDNSNTFIKWLLNSSALPFRAPDPGDFTGAYPPKPLEDYWGKLDVEYFSKLKPFNSGKIPEGDWPKLPKK